LSKAQLSGLDCLGVLFKAANTVGSSPSPEDRQSSSFEGKSRNSVIRSIFLMLVSFFDRAEDNKKLIKLIAAAFHLNVAEPLDS
jgi:hypothetical protein